MTFQWHLGKEWKRIKSNKKSKTKIDFVGTWNILETAPPLNFGRFWIWARKNRKRRKQPLENNGGKSLFVIFPQSKENPGKWNGARAKRRRKERRVLNGTFLPFFLTVWRGPPLSSFPRQRIEELKSGRILLCCTPSPSSYRSLRSPAIFLGGKGGGKKGIKNVNFDDTLQFLKAWRSLKRTVAAAV